MDGLEIKARLIRKGIKIKDIAKEAQVSASFVSMVIYGKKKSKKVQEIISRKLNEPYNSLWQDRK